MKTPPVQWVPGPRPGLTWSHRGRDVPERGEPFVRRQEFVPPAVQFILRSGSPPDIANQPQNSKSYCPYRIEDFIRITPRSQDPI
eukprot:9029542-Pyramimonas_sp.AAC.1